MAGKAEGETEIDLWRKNLAVQMTGSKDEVKNVGFRLWQLLAQTRIYDVGFGQNLPMPLPSLLKMAGNILLTHCFGCCLFLLRPLLARQQQRSRLVEELEVDEVVNDDDLKRIS